MNAFQILSISFLMPLALLNQKIARRSTNSRTGSFTNYYTKTLVADIEHFYIYVTNYKITFSSFPKDVA